MITTSIISIAAALIELILVLSVVMEVISKGHYSIDSYIYVDPLGAIILALIAIIGFIASWYSVGYLNAEMEKGIIGLKKVKQYFILLHLFLIAMYFAVTVAHPILMWIAIEATTLSTAFLISYYNKPSAVEAAWKYLVINSVGLLLGFFGTLLFLSILSQGEFHGLVDWRTLQSHASDMNPIIAEVAFIFVVIGYGTKVGFVPMHTWLPDAHSKAPAPISSLLSGVLLNVAFIAILRFKAIVDIAIDPNFSNQLLMFFGIISIVVAAFIIFVQKNYKRLLAYSSIEHMGIMALGFGFGGVGSFAALLHMIYHSLAKSLLFLSSGNIFLKYSSTKIYKIKGMLKALPMTSILFLIGFLAITGVPPFGIFITEFSILSAGIQNHPIITILALLAMVFVFIGFLKAITEMMYGENEPSISKEKFSIWRIAPIIILASLLIVLSVFVPSTMKTLIQLATLTY